jgi:hypothetical protein
MHLATNALATSHVLGQLTGKSHTIAAHDYDMPANPKALLHPSEPHSVIVVVLVVVVAAGTLRDLHQPNSSKGWKDQLYCKKPLATLRKSTQQATLFIGWDRKHKKNPHGLPWQRRRWFHWFPIHLQRSLDIARHIPTSPLTSMRQLLQGLVHVPAKSMHHTL